MYENKDFGAIFTEVIVKIVGIDQFSKKDHNWEIHPNAEDNDEN